MIVAVNGKIHTEDGESVQGVDVTFRYGETNELISTDNDGFFDFAYDDAKTLTGEAAFDSDSPAEGPPWAWHGTPPQRIAAASHRTVRNPRIRHLPPH